MPLLAGGRRPGFDPDVQLQRLANLFVEAQVCGDDLRSLEHKIATQTAWLDANRDHPRYPERCQRAWDVRKEHERALRRLHDITKDANRLTEEMDAATRQRAKEEIHEWAHIGSPGVYAVAWNLVPSAEWLEETEESA